MNADERRQRVIEFLAKRGFVDLAALTQELGVSDSTVRRDLTQLETEGLVRRTHGGAVFVSDRFSVLGFAARESTAAAEKAAMGRAAAELVQDDETILLDAGTTTFQVARALVGRRVQVVTNSLPIANLLGSEGKIELIFVGGFIYPRTGAAFGPLTNQMLTNIHVTKVFMGCAGISEDGLYNANALMVEAQHRMIQAADQVIVVADHTKFGKRALAQMMQLEDIDHLVTDDGIDESWRQRLAEHNVNLIVAPLEDSMRRVKEVSA